MFKKFISFFTFLVIFFGLFCLSSVAWVDAQTVTQSTDRGQIDVVTVGVEEPAEPSQLSRSQDSTVTVATDNRVITTAEDIPGKTSLFFRNLKQQIQLMFTFDSRKDAELRLQFSADNLQLATDIISLTQDSSLTGRANLLVTRAGDLVEQANNTFRELKDGDPQAIQALNESLTNYYKTVKPLMTILKDNPVFASENRSLTATLEKLDTEHTELQTFLEAQINEQPTKTTSGGTVPPDLDNDGISDDQEKEMGLDVLDYDTDQDSLSDRREIEYYGTDPTKVDTDNDGYRDGFEVMNGYNPAGDGTLKEHLAEQLNASTLQFISEKKTLPNLSPATLKFLNDAAQKYQQPRK